MDAASAVATYGYPAVLLGAVVEGETIVIAAGYLAHRHHLPIWPIVLCAAVGAMVGDQGFFLVGRRGGERVIARLPSRLGARAARARDTVTRHPVRTMLSMRFAYGMRVVLPILCGASGIAQMRFARYNVATAVTWAALFAGLGYAGGAAATAFIGELEHYEVYLLVGLVLVMIAIHRVAAWRSSRRARAITSTCRKDQHE